MQAFPFIEPEKDDNIKAYHSGMTMRDEFAKAALSCVLERWTKDAIKDKQPSLLECDGVPTDFAILVAEEVYAMADAMMKVRK